MSRYRWVFLGVTSVTMAFSSASADAIRPSSKVDAALVAAPEVARSGPEDSGGSRLALSPALVEGTWTDLARRPLLSSDLSGAALVDREARQGSPQALARPDLPKDPLLGASSERILAALSSQGSEAGADAASGPNIRIPGPASVALVAAGLIGLFARIHLRRKLQPKVEKNPA